MPPSNIGSNDGGGDDDGDDDDDDDDDAYRMPTRTRSWLVPLLAHHHSCQSHSYRESLPHISCGRLSLQSLLTWHLKRAPNSQQHTGQEKCGTLVRNSEEHKIPQHPQTLQGPTSFQSSCL